MDSEIAGPGPCLAQLVRSVARRTTKSRPPHFQPGRAPIQPLSLLVRVSLVHPSLPAPSASSPGRLSRHFSVSLPSSALFLWHFPTSSLTSVSLSALLFLCIHYHHHRGRLSVSRRRSFPVISTRSPLSAGTRRPHTLSLEVPVTLIRPFDCPPSSSPTPDSSTFLDLQSSSHFLRPWYFNNHFSFRITTTLALHYRLVGLLILEQRWSSDRGTRDSRAFQDAPTHRTSISNH